MTTARYRRTGLPLNSASSEIWYAIATATSDANVGFVLPVSRTPMCFA